jgi:hypothetical protein
MRHICPLHSSEAHSQLQTFIRVTMVDSRLWELSVSSSIGLGVRLGGSGSCNAIGAVFLILSAPP